MNQSKNRTEISTLRPSPDALLNPRLDPIFKSLFTQNSHDSNAALKAFLSVMLHQNITDVDITQNELPIESERDKQSIFDLTCRTENGRKVLNVEMQGKNDLDSFDNRSEYHVAHLLNHFVKKSMLWNEVPEAVIISVLNFVYDENVKNGFLEYTMRLEDGTGLKSSRLKIIFLELPKYEKIPDAPLEKLTAEEKWGKFFLYANRSEKQEYLKILAESEDGIMYAQNALNSISQSDAEWRRERDYLDAVITEATIRNQAERKGYAAGEKQGYETGEKRGIQQGLQQAHVESAKKLLQMNILTPEQIAQAVSLPLEDVLALKEQK